MARPHVLALAGLILIFGVVQAAWPDEPAVFPGVTASTEPATLPTTRYVMTIPPGMHLLEVGGRSAICFAKDDEVVRLAMGEVKPPTRPTTMPSDLLARLTAVRPALAKEMATDLALPDGKIAAFLDGKLAPLLKKMVELKAPIYVLVATQDQLAAAMAAGWTGDPRHFHYNPLAHHAFYRAGLRVDIDQAPDDVILWAEVKPGMSPADIADTVVKAYQEFESGFATWTANQAMVVERDTIVQFISDEAIDPLKLGGSQQWFGLGVMRVLSSKYTSELTEIPKTALMAALTAENRDNPLKAAPLDLMHLPDPTSIKPQYLPFFIDALSRKSTQAVGVLDDKAGDGAITKVLIALKATPTPDNDALVKLIHDLTGVDLTSALQPAP